jgi:OOP family OmpA-OmpF porin
MKQTEFKSMNADRCTLLKAFSAVGALSMLLVTGCSTKNYVRSQTAPIIQHTNELDDATATNNRNIKDVDQRAQQGITQAQTAADVATQKASQAGQSATQAQGSAQEAVTRADSLASVVKNLDNYKSIADVSVTFGFDKAVLSKSEKAELDKFATSIGDIKSYILEVTGGTDSTGDAQYNYGLSQRRADVVVQYLASTYHVAPHRFYLIGIGKDVEVAPNTTAAGRAKNRRVTVQLLTNTTTPGAPAQPAAVSSVQ